MSDELPGAAGDLAGLVAGLRAGTRIAGYRLEEQAGQGSAGVVFRARDEGLDRLVALKVLAPALAADEEFRQRFIRESRAAAAVDDPHIIPVFQAGETGGVLFIAMRYVAGRDARTLLRQEGPLPAIRAAAIVSPVASALDAAHSAGLVHRDVKPANMLVEIRPGQPDHVYLSDFGLPGTGPFPGTIEYSAPEQIEGKPVDGRADQYALACAAFELLTGAPPFRRAEATLVRHAQLSDPPPKLSDRRPGMPAGADLVFAQALAKAPRDRYASCQEFAAALRVSLGLPPYAPAGAGPAGAVAPGAVASPWDIPPLAPIPGVAAGSSAAAPAPASTQSSDAPAVASAQSGAAHGKPRRRPAVPWLVAGAAAAVIVAVIAWLLVGSSGPAQHVSFAIAAQSSLTPVTGDAYVVYRGGKDATATIRGQIKGADSGEVARLYAQQFPYSQPGVPAGSATLRRTGQAASYAFQVTPGLATRYRVELFTGSAATAPVAISPAVTVYVSSDIVSGSAQKCRIPVCGQTFRMRVFVPPSTMSAEIAKRWYDYFAISLSAGKEPTPPHWEQLGAGGAQISKPRRVSATEFDLTISLSFRVGNDAFSWDQNACTADTEARDGLGLPGRHGCGAKRIPAAASYLG